MAEFGDDLVPQAAMVYNRSRTLEASPDEIWPWLVQLGRHRAGWYAPAWLERVIPRSRRALRHLDDTLQDLAVGDRIPDWGGKDAGLEVVAIEPPHGLLYRDERRGVPFSWAITLEPVSGASTRVHLRFRGGITSTGLRRRLIVAGGDLIDWLTTAVMLRGLQERVERPDD